MRGDDNTYPCRMKIITGDELGLVKEVSLDSNKVARTLTTTQRTRAALALTYSSSDESAVRYTVVISSVHVLRITSFICC